MATENQTPPLPSPACGGGKGRGDPSDIVAGDWDERFLPVRFQPYARLARLDRPIGTWLLLFPGWWGIALASSRAPSPVLLVLFAFGAVVSNSIVHHNKPAPERHSRGGPARRGSWPPDPGH